MLIREVTAVRKDRLAEHGFVYRDTDKAFVIEHYIDGRWIGCPLAVVGEPELEGREVGLVAMWHLQAKRTRHGGRQVRVGGITRTKEEP